MTFHNCASRKALSENVIRLMVLIRLVSRSRFTVLASAVPSLAGWIVIAAAPGSVSTAVLGRLLVGIGMGIAGAIYPVGKFLEYFWKPNSSHYYHIRGFILQDRNNTVICGYSDTFLTGLNCSRT